MRMPDKIKVKIEVPTGMHIDQAMKDKIIQGLVDSKLDERIVAAQVGYIAEISTVVVK